MLKRTLGPVGAGFAITRRRGAFKALPETIAIQARRTTMPRIAPTAKSGSAKIRSIGALNFELDLRTFIIK